MVLEHARGEFVPNQPWTWLISGITYPFVQKACSGVVIKAKLVIQYVYRACFVHRGTVMPQGCLCNSKGPLYWILSNTPRPLPLFHHFSIWEAAFSLYLIYPWDLLIVKRDSWAQRTYFLCSRVQCQCKQGFWQSRLIDAHGQWRLAHVIQSNKWATVAQTDEDVNAGSDRKV